MITEDDLKEYSKIYHAKADEMKLKIHQCLLNHHLSERENGYLIRDAAKIEGVLNFITELYENHFKKNNSESTPLNFIGGGCWWWLDCK